MRLGLLGDLDHLLALADVPGHQLFAQHVLAGLHAVDGDRGVQVQRQGDDDRLDVLVLAEHLLVVGVHVVWSDVLGLRRAVDGLLSPCAATGSGSPSKMRFWLDGRMSHSGDELEVLRVVFADEDAALVAAADEGGLDRLALAWPRSRSTGGRDRRQAGGPDRPCSS